MQTLLDVILPVFFVIACGYVAVWSTYFPTSGIDALMKFSQGFAIPVLLFKALATIDLSTSFDTALLLSFYGGAAICFALGILGARMLFHRDWQDSVAIGFCCLFSNSVLLGLPISERAFGPDNLAANYMIIAVHSPFCYFLGITVMEVVRNAGQPRANLARAVTKAMFSNPLVIGILLGIAMNISGQSIPAVLDDGLDLIIQAALPTALFALGGVMIQYRPEGDMKAIAMVCVIALLVHPALTYSFGTALSVDPDLFRPAVITAAMAPGFNAYIFANMYGRARRVAASSVLISTAASIFTAWVWLTLLI